MNRRDRRRRHPSQTDDPARLLDDLAATADRIEAEFPAFREAFARADPIAADMLAMLRGAPAGRRAEFLDGIDIDRLVAAFQAIHPTYLSGRAEAGEDDPDTGGT